MKRVLMLLVLGVFVVTMTGCSVAMVSKVRKDDEVRVGLLSLHNIEKTQYIVAFYDGDAPPNDTLQLIQIYSNKIEKKE